MSPDGIVGANVTSCTLAHCSAQLGIHKQGDHVVRHCANIMLVDQKSGVTINNDIRDAGMTRGYYRQRGSSRFKDCYWRSFGVPV